MENYPIAIYGISSNTKIFLEEIQGKYNIVGLLDGYKKDGEIFGHKIISLEKAIELGIKAIIVVARPSSRRIIVNRIREKCIENSISLYDIDGHNLLYVMESKEEHIEPGISRKELLEKIVCYDVISFDIFDTLLTRNVLYPTDVFELVEIKLLEKFGQSFDFARKRQQAEYELSQQDVPTIDDIYNKIHEDNELGSDIIDFAKATEWQIENEILILRDDMCEMLNYAAENNKIVYLVSDMYYSSKQLKQILFEKGVTGYHKIIVSCEYGCTKSTGLFDVMKKDAKKDNKYLHIGDNYSADILGAERTGIEGVWIRSSTDMFDMMSWSRDFVECDSLSDKIKLGFFVSRIFNSPFALEDGTIVVEKLEDFGFLYIAPIVTDFVIWLYKELSEKKNCNILFAARDGYLIKKLYDILTEYDKNEWQNSIYLLTSRISAIFNSLMTKSDVRKVASLEFNGSFHQMLNDRFMLEDEDIKKGVNEIDEYIDIILYNAKISRGRYIEYLNKLPLCDGEMIFYDFVSSGTCQIALEKIMKCKMKGYYFMRVNEKNNEKSDLNIQSLYSNEGEAGRRIYENYFIMEYFLSALVPSFSGFDEELNVIYSTECRSEKELEFVKIVQKSIIQYFVKYIKILGISKEKENSLCSENILDLFRRVSINDNIFKNMTWKDEFFKRSVKVKDMM